jgi:hypothetical protein
MAKIADPPPWPLADMVAVARTTLIQRGEWGKKRPYPPTPSASPQHDPPNLASEDEARIYPFTKGLEISNEGIGYGEETTVSVLDTRGKPSKQVRRRTRTGSIVLEPPPVPLKPGQLRSTPSVIAPAPDAQPTGSPALRNAHDHGASEQSVSETSAEHRPATDSNSGKARRE